MCNDSISALEWFIAAVCESCLEDRLEEERRSQLVYSRAAIYVRQVDKIGALTDILLDAPSILASSSSTAEDPDFQVIFVSLFVFLNNNFPLSLSHNTTVHHSLM